MNKKLSILSVLVIVVLLLIPFGFLEAAAGVPTIISYQGRLTDSSGNLLGSTSGTTYYFKFSIWDVATGGSASPDRLWPASGPTSIGLSVRSGVFTANIGDTANGYPDTLDYDFNSSSDIFLQVEVSSDNSTFQTLTPRQRIGASAFSRVSGAVSGTGPSSFGTVTPFGTSVVSVAATSTNATPLSIRGILSQIANLFQIQDSTGTNLFSVNSSGNVAIGSAAVGSRKLNVLDVNSVPQLRLSQSGSVYGEFYVDSTGDVQFSSTGGNMRMQDENLWVCSGGSCGVPTPAEKGNIIVETSVIFNNRFRLKQVDASTTIMYDSAGNDVLEFDEAQ